MDRKKRVKMGDYRVGQDDNVLSSIGIGSCVAVCLYDHINHIGGVAHVMFPDKAANPPKSAQVLINDMIVELEAAGASKDALKAKLFGGASLLSTSLNIGEENLEAVRRILSRHRIPIVAEDTGGDTGRSVWLNCRTGDVVVQKPFEPTERY